MEGTTWLRPPRPIADLLEPDRVGDPAHLAAAIVGLAVPAERMVGDVELHDAAADGVEPLALGLDFSPSATGVVQEAGVPPRPSISTRQTRHEPNASSMSVAHSFGISTPASIAARMIEVPSGTVTLRPSISSVTAFSDLEAGVP